MYSGHHHFHPLRVPRQRREPLIGNLIPRRPPATARGRGVSGSTAGCGYEAGDPYVDFVPPPLETDGDGQAPYDRAVVFVTDETKKGTARNGQEYVDPLLVLTGEEYAKMPFQVLLDRLQETVRSGPRVAMEFLAPDGTTRRRKRGRESFSRAGQQTD